MADDLHEKLGRLLERTEAQGQQLERLIREGALRDAARREEANAQTNALREAKEEITDILAQKVRDGVHDQLNAIQPAIAALDRRLVGIETRVTELEAPVRRALAIKLRRRKLWVKITGVAALVGTAAAAVAEPIWKAVADPLVRLVLKHWIGQQ